MKKFISILLFFTFITPSANAIYKGEDVSDNTLVAKTDSGCSAAPISTRILILAQHCSVKTGSTLISFYEEGKNNKVLYRVISSFVPSKDYIDNRENDIMAIVVDKDMPIKNNIKIASYEDIKRFTDSESIVYFYGHGLVDRYSYGSTPSRAAFKFVKNPPAYMNGHDGYTEFYSINNLSEVCSGDSGGPSYVFDNDYVYYLGATVSSNKPFCSSDSQSISLARNALIYHHLYLIDQAKEFLLANPLILEPIKSTKIEETTTVVIATTPVSTKPKVIVKKIATTNKKIVKKLGVKK
jgi:hypothetical protein